MISDKIMKLVADHAGVPVKETSTFKELDLDSLDQYELVMAVEDEFEIHIPDEHAAEFLAVSDLINYITSRRIPGLGVV